MAEEACEMNSFNVLDVTEFKLGDLVQFVHPHEDFGSSDGVYSIVKIYKDDVFGTCCNVKKDDGTECKVVVKITKLRHVVVNESLQKNILNSNLDICKNELFEIDELDDIADNLKFDERAIETFVQLVKFYKLRAKYAVEQKDIDSYDLRVVGLISKIRTFKKKALDMYENQLLESLNALKY